MLYLITGPAGVGKSTVSKALAKRSNKSVLIEGDDIYHHVISGYKRAWEDGNHLDVFWKICEDMIATYLSYGYDVIFNYIFNIENFNTFKDNFSNYSNYSKKFIILITDEKTIIKRDLERPLDCQMGERSVILLEKFKKEPFESKYYLDTSNLSVEKTVNKIEINDEYIFLKLA